MNHAGLSRMKELTAVQITIKKNHLEIDTVERTETDARI
jgi:hypothetical protein